jgi:hypothetical protein
MLCISSDICTLYPLHVPHLASHNVDVSVAGGVIASILGVICLFWVGAVDDVGFREQRNCAEPPWNPYCDWIVWLLLTQGMGCFRTSVLL